MENNMYNVGKIVNTHGVKGEVRVIRITDFEERFAPDSELYAVHENEGSSIPLVVDGHRKHKNFDLLHFEGYNSLNEAEKLKDAMLKVKEDQLSSLEEGEFYYHQVIGCMVFTLEGEELGPVEEILSPGANDVWVIRRKNQKDLLIPYIEEVVKTVDVKEKKIFIDPMEGMLEQ